jgi:hypothetical protein
VSALDDDEYGDEHKAGEGDIDEDEHYQGGTSR